VLSGNRHVGSNPTLSAIHIRQALERRDDPQIRESPGAHNTFTVTRGTGVRSPTIHVVFKASRSIAKSSARLPSAIGCNSPPRSVRPRLRTERWPRSWRSLTGRKCASAPIQARPSSSASIRRRTSARAPPPRSRVRRHELQQSGADADRVLLYIDSELAGERLVNRRLAYVALSRGRHDAQIYTDDRDRLSTALSRDVSKSSAHSVKSAEQTPPHRDRAPWAAFTVSCNLRDMGTHLCALPTGEYRRKGLVCLGCTHAKPKQSAAPIFRRMLASHERALGTAQHRGEPAGQIAAGQLEVSRIGHALRRRRICRPMSPRPSKPRPAPAERAVRRI
jgi:hypothetical protein